MTTPPPDSAKPEASLWFYADTSNQPQGPITYTELQRLAQKGIVGSGTLIIEEGAQEWVTYSSLLDADDALVPPVAESPKPQVQQIAPTFDAPTLGFWKRLTTWGKTPIGVGLIVFALAFKIAIHLLPSHQKPHSIIPTAAVSKPAENKHEAEKKAQAGLPHAQSTGAKNLRLTNSSLADVLDEIQDNFLTYPEAAEIAIRWENTNVGIERMAGEFLIYNGTNRAGRLFRVALLRDKKMEAEYAKKFSTLEEYYDCVRTGSFDSRDPMIATGFVRIAGTAHFTTRNGVMIELPLIEVVPPESVKSFPR